MCVCVCLHVYKPNTLTCRCVNKLACLNISYIQKNWVVQEQGRLLCWQLSTIPCTRLIPSHPPVHPAPTSKTPRARSHLELLFVLQVDYSRCSFINGNVVWGCTGDIDYVLFYGACGISSHILLADLFSHRLVLLPTGITRRSQITLHQPHVHYNGLKIRV